MSRIYAVVLALFAVLGTTTASADDRCAGEKAREFRFAPEDDAEGLVLKVIQSSRDSIRLAAYSLTSPPIVKALVEARRRGVDVAVVADYRHNLGEDEDNRGRSRAKAAARTALNLLVNAGIPTRTVSAFPIAHDKAIVSDNCHVQTGSFNYSLQARTNAENVIVLWNDPGAAAAYLQHWNRSFRQGVDYRPSY